MICPYCRSDKIILKDGEYICTECGTVLGFEVVAPVPKQSISVIRRRTIFLSLEKENKKTINMKYSDIVKFYINKISTELAIEDIREVAWDLFQKLDKRVYQGKNPRVIAASVVYLAAEAMGVQIYKQTIAKIVNISKFTIRDTVSKLRRHVSTTH